MHFADIPAFAGLIQKEEYDAIAQQHRDESSAKTGRKNREPGLRQVVEKKGIHAHTTEERKAVSKLAAIARGFRPYDQSELDLINELALLPEYQRLSRINAVKIAKELNDRLYKGEQVRTAKQVRKMRYVSKNARQ